LSKSKGPQSPIASSFPYKIATKCNELGSPLVWGAHGNMENPDIRSASPHLARLLWLDQNQSLITPGEISGQKSSIGPVWHHYGTIMMDHDGN